MRKQPFNITRTARSLAAEHGTDFDTTRLAIRNAVRSYMEAHGLQSLPADCMVPGHLPDGALFVIMPDVHKPANDRRIRRALKQFHSRLRG